MKSPRAVRVMIHRDGDLSSRSFRLPLWAARLVLTGAAVVAVALVIGVVLYAPIVRTAATVPGLQRRVAQLESENEQVHQLARTLAEAERRYEQIRGMLGGDVVPAMRAAPGSDPMPVAVPILAAAADARARYEVGLSLPTHWPVRGSGIVTRGQVNPGVRDETHSGVDIAVPLQTPIRAAGGGVVSETGRDAEYGVFVILDHPSGYQSLYGHASRLLVGIGDSVAAGQVIALSGTTGRSTGPHLHFEIRQDGRAVDPRSLVKDLR